MFLPESKLICSSAVENVHFSAVGTLPEYGEIVSVIPSCPDSGTVFTVYSCGVSDFIFKNTCNITLTINTIETSVHAFLNLAPGFAARPVPHRRNFKHERKTMQSTPFTGRRMALRL